MRPNVAEIAHKMLLIEKILRSVGKKWLSSEPWQIGVTEARWPCSIHDTREIHVKLKDSSKDIEQKEALVLGWVLLGHVGEDRERGKSSPRHSTPKVQR